MEKSRAVRQAGDERTFHIFYQCLSGMDDAEKKEFLFQQPKTYKFLSNGNLPVPGVNDSQEFEDTKEAMNIMGMSDEEKNCETLGLKFTSLNGWSGHMKWSHGFILDTEIDKSP